MGCDLMMEDGIGDDHVGPESIFIGGVLDALLLSIGSDVLVGSNDCVERVVAGLLVFHYRAGFFALLEVILLVAEEEILTF